MSTHLDNFLPGSVIGEIVSGKDVTSIALSWHGGAADPSMFLQVIP